MTEDEILRFRRWMMNQNIGSIEQLERGSFRDNYWQKLKVEEMILADFRTK